MLHVLAQASPSPEALKQWLEVVLYIAGSIATCAIAWSYITGRSGKTSIDNQPIEVKAHAGSVTREEYDQTHGRISRERDELKREIHRVETASEKRTDKLEEKIDENTTATAAMGGQLHQMNQTLSGLTESLTNFMRDQANRK